MRAAYAVIGASLALLVGAPAASADQTIYAGFGNTFLTPNVTIDQGEALSFSNFDLVGHDVTSKDSANGKPIFASALTGAGGTEPVFGAQALKAGSYAFICSIHPNMTGTLTVTGSGTPSPPQSGGGGGSGAAPADTKAPALSIKVLDKKVSATRKRGALDVSINVDEDSSVALTAKVGKTVVATTSAQRQAGAAKLSMPLTKAGVKLFRKSKKLTVTVSGKAGDAAGNAGKASAKKKLR